MGIDFQSDKPIYQQLVDRISREIVRGDRQPGQKLPSVREYAIEVGVNANTISRVYRELESETIVETRRGQGTFVTENEARLDSLRQELKQQNIESFIKDMEEMGFTLTEMIDGLKIFGGGEKK